MPDKSCEAICERIILEQNICFHLAGFRFLSVIKFNLFHSPPHASFLSEGEKFFHHAMILWWSRKRCTAEIEKKYMSFLPTAARNWFLHNYFRIFENSDGFFFFSTSKREWNRKHIFFQLLSFIEEYFPRYDKNPEIIYFWEKIFEFFGDTHE